ncbi:hypothetical protein [Bacillus mesophilum]|uniref:hypothetical protein n=1 Tax=Bacillus mesophilum TaxID=1071718 RepID=UPI001F02AB53|nr:hypothetical protein [Bacillus mesophilum]
MQWNSSELKKKLFDQVGSASVLRLPFYDSMLDRQIQKKVDLSHSDIIIIEGVFLQRSEWRESFDYLLYIDSPRTTRFQRENDELKKNLNKFKNRYWKAEDYYIDNINPAKKADAIISN